MYCKSSLIIVLLLSIATVLFAFFVAEQPTGDIDGDETQLNEEIDLPTPKLEVEVEVETKNNLQSVIWYIPQKKIEYKQEFIPHENFIRNDQLVNIGESYYPNARKVTEEEHYLIFQYCGKWDIDYDLMLALFYVETGCNIDRDPYDGYNPKWKTAYYGAGSVGATWGKWCEEEFGLDIKDKYQALEASCAIMSTYIKDRQRYYKNYDRCVMMALAKYNTGSFELSEKGTKYAKAVLYYQKLIKNYYGEK